MIAVFAFGSLVNVNAMTEESLKEKLTQAYTINGEVVQANDSQVVEIERYLNKYEISSEDADYIAAKIDETVKIAQDAKASSFTELTTSERNQIIALIIDISNKTSVKVTLANDGKLTVYEEDGKTPFTVITDKDNGIKQTDSNKMFIVVASIISVFGVVFVARKVTNENAQ